MTKCSYLYLGDPSAKNHGGTLRVKSLVAALRDSGVEVDVVFPQTPSGTAATPSGRLGRLGAVKRHYLPMPTLAGGTDRDLSRRLRASAPDFVIVSVASQWPTAFEIDRPVWIDFLDVWSAFARREAATRRGLARFTALGQGAVLSDAERRYTRRASLVTSVGWADHELLASRGTTSTWLPVAIEGGTSQARRPEGLQPTVGLLGNFDFWPNREAFNLLTSEWAPRLRDLGWRCVVAGLHSDRLPPSPLVDNLGQVARVDEFYDQVTATMAPIRLGGGMKVKVVESLVHGVPAITTTEAAEGLPPDVRDLLTICNDADDLPAPGQLDQLAPQPPALRPFSQAHTRDVVAKSLQLLAHH